MCEQFELERDVMEPWEAAVKLPERTQIPEEYEDCSEEQRERYREQAAHCNWTTSYYDQ